MQRIHKLSIKLSILALGFRLLAWIKVYLVSWRYFTFFFIYLINSEDKLGFCFADFFMLFFHLPCLLLGLNFLPDHVADEYEEGENEEHCNDRQHEDLLWRLFLLRPKWC